MPDAASDAGELVVFFERKHKRWVVRSRDLAVHTAHEHFNILGAVRVAEAEMTAVGLRSTVIWGQYLARNRRWNPACQIPLEVLRRIRLHNVPGCRRVQQVLAQYVRLLEEREPPAEPAPDSEIRPPEPEPAGLFDAVEPPGDPAASWEINAAVALLTKRTGLPRFIAEDLDGWNTARCAALWAASRSWDEVGAIYATKAPGADA
jgi:hypothetical protein